MDHVSTDMFSKSKQKTAMDIAYRAPYPLSKGQDKMRNALADFSRLGALESLGSARTGDKRA